MSEVGLAREIDRENWKKTLQRNKKPANFAHNVLKCEFVSTEDFVVFIAADSDLCIAERTVSVLVLRLINFAVSQVIIVIMKVFDGSLPHKNILLNLIAFKEVNKVSIVLVELHWIVVVFNID